VQRVKLWSDILQKKLDIRVTTHALRTMDRMGGLDNYLLLTSDAHLASKAGSALKQLLWAELAKRGDQPQWAAYFNEKVQQR
jgi:large subunit ribosomal protein L28